VFEFQLQSRELTKHGVRLKVQEQPIQILAALLEQAGQIVPREDLQRRLWPDGTFVDYDQSLNKAVNKLREALGDAADRPIYIETLTRRGYRFVAPVEGDPAETPAAGTTNSRRRMLPWLAAGGIVLAMVFATGLWPIDVPQVVRVVPLTNDTSFKIAFGRLISNGNRVLYSDGADVWSVPASGGEPRRLSLPFLRDPDWPRAAAAPGFGVCAMLPRAQPRSVRCAVSVRAGGGGEREHPTLNAQRSTPNGQATWNAPVDVWR